MYSSSNSGAKEYFSRPSYAIAIQNQLENQKLENQTLRISLKLHHKTQI